MRDTYTLLLLWLFPVAISLHVFEEFALPGGLKQWIQEYKPRKARSDFYYFIINAAAIVGRTILAWRASGTLGFCIYLISVAIMAVCHRTCCEHFKQTILSGLYLRLAYCSYLYAWPAIGTFFASTRSIYRRPSFVCV